MKKIITSLATILLLMSFTSSTDNAIIDVVTKLKQREAAKGSEKLFLHLDRPLYFSGENIWFQSYLVSASAHLLITFERILYVELINPMGVTTTKRMFKLQAGKCNGNLQLGNDLSSGKYLLVAYTNWMRNQGAEFFFKKEIKIINEEDQARNKTSINEAIDTIKQSQTLKNITSEKRADLQLNFMPEGGEILAGINCRVAFAGVNQAGKAMNYSGKIVDEEGKFYSIIQPLYDGKGFFIFKPVEGKKYKAIVKGNQGKELTYPLPEVKSVGYALMVENRWKTDSLDILVNSVGVEQGSKVILIAQQDGEVKEVIQGRLGKNMLRFRLPKNIFSTGIVQITLFNEQMIHQCERLVFINQNEQLKIKVNGLEDDIYSREKIELELEVTDNDGEPVEGTFSMAVTDATMIGDENYSKANLVNHMYLTSNLPGRIDNLEFYFQNTSSSHIGLDLLMLVNGWRRFRWHEVLADSVPKPKYALEQGIFVEGKLKRKGSGREAPKGIEVTMMLQGEEMGVYSAETDEHGRFEFAVREFNDTVNVLVQTRNRLNNKADFSIDLSSNLRFDAADYNARKLMVKTEEISTTFYQSEALRQGEVKAIKGSMREQYKRLAAKGFFQDTTDVLIEDIVVAGVKKKSAQEEMAEEYGVPSYVIGQRQIEDLVKAKPWNNGLVSILYDAIPGLKVFTSVVIDNEGFGSNTFSEPEIDAIDSLAQENDEFSTIGNDRTVEFSLTDKSLHRFYIFVDKQLVGMTDDRGILMAMLNTLSFDDFISMDPLAVKSIELIFDPRESPLFDMYQETNLYDELIGGPEAILSIYTKGGNGIFSRSYNKGMANFRLYGFERVREFYSPQYDGTDDHKYIKDERATLLWKPMIQTDSLGMAKVEFYNSDIASKLRVDVAGFSKGGLPGAALVVRGKNKDTSDDLNEGVGEKETGKYQDYTETASVGSNQNLFKGSIMVDHKVAANYASIVVKGADWSTTSNQFGQFFISKDDVNTTDTIEISIPTVGYTALTFAELTKNNGQVKITSSKLNKDAKEDANKLVQQMIRSRRQNSTTKTHYIQGVYRQLVSKGRDLYGLDDFSIIQKREGIGTSLSPHQTMPIQGRYYKTEDYRMQIKYDPLNTLDDLVPVMDPLYKSLPFLNNEYRRQYDFIYHGLINYQGRKMYKVGFDQKDDINKAFFGGVMLIDKQTLGLAYVKWKLSDKGRKYEIPQMFLMPAENMEGFKTIEENNEALYNYEDGKWKLKLAVQQLEFDINNTRLSFSRELMVTQNMTEKPDHFKSTMPKKMNRRRMLIKDVNYQPQFWREAWCLPADKYINTQIKHLHEVTFYK